MIEKEKPFVILGLMVSPKNDSGKLSITVKTFKIYFLTIHQFLLKTQ